MSKPVLVDCHTHCSFSFDSESSLGDMIHAAKANGITVCAVTDHAEHCSTLESYRELGVYKKNWYSDTSRWLQALKAAKPAYAADGIKLLCGVELGEPMQDVETAGGISAQDYDIIIGSLHNVNQEDDFYYLDFKAMTSRELDRLMNFYFAELLDMAHWGGFDTLAHLTYPLRYLKKQGFCYDFARFDQTVSDIFSVLIKNGIALELNTSGIARGGTFTMPDEHFLHLYRQTGGELLTIGSDAHEPRHAGGGILEGYELARRAGFTRVTYFEKRRPVFVELP